MYLIVGIDAGLHVGYALLDLNGQLVKAGVEKEASENDIIRINNKYGTASVVACDVNPPAHFVVKVAAMVNARLFKPTKSLKVEAKRHIAKDITDPHTRDAYAAAVKAYRRYANRLRQINLMGTSLDKDKLKAHLIRGEQLDRAIKLIKK